MNTNMMNGGRKSRPLRSQCRYIAHDDILTKYHAKRWLWKQEKLSHDDDDDSTKKHDCLSNHTPVDVDDVTIGIQISSWFISTRASTIAHENEIELLTQHLEKLANEPILHILKTNTSENNSSYENDSMTPPTIHIPPTRKRRLCLPESVYFDANVNILHENKSIEFSFDAISALSEWSTCHNHLTQSNNSHDFPPNNKEPKKYNNNNNNHEKNYLSSIEVYRGVSILKSIDAPLWSQKIIPTDFNYDWSFSTPYSGTTITTRLHQENNDETTYSFDWIPCHESGMDMTLLTDQSLPILYYDEIKLFEDDMHDNGYTSLSCKIRVMPTCLLCLMTLFVRIDYVLVRIKEVRIFISFHHVDQKNDDNDYHSKKRRIWKDITWRECAWNQLVPLGLPNHIQAWRLEENTALTGKELQLHQQRIQTMIRKLPMIELPSDLPNISYFQC